MLRGSAVGYELLALAFKHKPPVGWNAGEIDDLAGQ